MKSSTYLKPGFLRISAMVLLLGCRCVAYAQDADSISTEATEVATAIKKAKPVKNTFGSIWLIDNQTVMVPIKKTFEMDIMHRFGTMGNGYKDFYGLFASSNIKIGLNYVPIDNLLIGASLTKSFTTLEGFAKYALLKQTKGKYPLSLSYYVNAAWDTRPGDNYIHNSDEWMFFHQLMIARKLTEKLSLQVAPSVTHVNYVNGYFKSIKTEAGADSNVVAGERKHEHFAIAFMGRYKLTQGMALIVNYDQPITKHLTGNPKPNISLGLEVATSSHAFQFFIGNYYHLSPQRNNYFNQNHYKEGFPWQSGNQFLIGFNITRLWNY
jgi:hypothetical protein